MISTDPEKAHQASEAGVPDVEALPFAHTCYRRALYGFRSEQRFFLLLDLPVFLLALTLIWFSDIRGELFQLGIVLSFVHFLGKVWHIYWLNRVSKLLTAAGVVVGNGWDAATDIEAVFEKYLEKGVDENSGLRESEKGVGYGSLNAV